MPGGKEGPETLPDSFQDWVATFIRFSHCQKIAFAHSPGFCHTVFQFRFASARSLRVRQRRRWSRTDDHAKACQIDHAKMRVNRHPNMSISRQEPLRGGSIIPSFRGTFLERFFFMVEGIDELTSVRQRDAVKRELEWCSTRVADTLDYLRYCATLMVLRDLLGQGWRIQYRQKSIFLVRPDLHPRRRDPTRSCYRQSSNPRCHEGRAAS